MIRNLLRAGAMALALLSSPASTQQLGATISFVFNPYIEKVSCDGGTGTGFKLADGRWVSANHVTELGGCEVDGLPIIVTGFDDRTDWSTFIVPGDNRRGGLTPDCSGYQDRTWYHGQGHARGLPIVTSTPVLFSSFMQGNSARDWATLIYNRFIPGMSGGAVLGSDGRVVGIVNAYNLFFPASASIALKDTPICQPS
jgi:hypothetical protein